MTIQIEPGPLAIDREREYRVSASQIQMWNQCPRKWAFAKLAHVPRVDAPWFAFGTAMHAEIARWLEHGTPPDQLTDFGRLAAEGIPYLPEPGVAEIERTVHFALAGVPMIAILDVLVPPIDGAPPRVIDHKSIGDRRRALCAEDLAIQVQPIIYAHVGLERFGGESIGVTWLYYPKRGGRVFPVDTVLDRGHVAAAIAATVTPIAQTLYAIRSKHNNESIEWCNGRIQCDPIACDFVGQFCDAAQHCNLTNGDRIMTKEEIDAKLADIQAKRAAGAPAPVATAPAPAPVATAPAPAPVASAPAPVATAPAPAPAPAPVGDTVLAAVAELRRAGFRVTLEIG